MKIIKNIVYINIVCLILLSINTTSFATRPTTDTNRPTGADTGTSGTTSSGSNNSGIINRPNTDINRPTEADTGAPPRTRYWK